MESIDPATGQPLPADAIQRVLFIMPKVHVYNIPPLTSTKGYTAATWTEDPKRHIFTARIRLVETAIPQLGGAADGGGGGEDRVKADVVLEDGSSGQLFAAAPYTSADVVEPALDSSRFFALRVRDGAGRKAVLGLGFEERGEAFDFSVALQEARKTLGLDHHHHQQQQQQSGPSSAAENKKPAQQQQQEREEEKRDYSLKEGETITVSFGGSKFGSGRRSRPQQAAEPAAAAAAGGLGSLSGFSLPPPPPPSSSGTASTTRGSAFPLPPPPPGAHSHSTAGANRTTTSGGSQKKSAEELGFDDGQFGEFA